MAIIVKVDSNANNQTAEAYGACKAIQNGFATLYKMNQLRLDSIGVGQAEKAANFGVHGIDQPATDAMAAAYSDRWQDAINAWNDSVNTEFEKIRVLVEPLQHDPA
jgi:hypothetical protein